MASAEVVELPRDSKGRQLHIGDEVLTYTCGKPVGQGEVVSMTLVLLEPTAWYVDLRLGVIGDRRWRTTCSGFGPYDLEIIEEDGSDDAD